MYLTPDNYFSPEANMQYMSVSQFKSFSKCQYSALAELKGIYTRETTTALLVGSYVDAYFEGTLPRFVSEHPEIMKRDGTLKAEYIQANNIINRIERDKLFMQYMSGEPQIIMGGTINGIDVKIKVDSLHDDKIVDLKIIKDFDTVYDAEKGSLQWWEYWEYDLQGAVYQEIVRQNTGLQLPFYLAAATKEKTTDIDILHIPQNFLDFQLEIFKENVTFFDAIKKGIIEPERCGKCDYCKDTKILTDRQKRTIY